MECHIKGSCEHCGFRYEGRITNEIVICPNCGKQTNNFDTASEVEAVDKAEGRKETYTYVTF